MKLNCIANAMMSLEMEHPAAFAVEWSSGKCISLADDSGGLVGATCVDMEPDRDDPSWKQATSSDPQINFPEVPGGLGDMGGLYVEMTAKTPTGFARADLFFAVEQFGFSETIKLELSIQADGNRHGYLFPIPLTFGDIVREDLRYIRFDPIDLEGSFRLWSAQLVPQEFCPVCDRHRVQHLGLGDLKTWIVNADERPYVSLHSSTADDMAFGELQIRLAARTSKGEGTLEVLLVGAENRDVHTDRVSLQADGDTHLYRIPLPGVRWRRLAIMPLGETGEFLLSGLSLHPLRYGREVGDGFEDTPIVYIHIPKAAGNTVNRYLLDHLPAESYLECRRPGEDLIDNAPLDKYSVVTGHFGHKALELFEGAAPRVMTVLRHPVDQVASFYYFLRSQVNPPSEYPGINRIMKLVHESDILAFVQSEMLNARMLTDNHQTWKIGHGAYRWRGVRFVARDEEMLEQAKRHLESYDVVGIQEDMVNTTLLMCYRLDLPMQRRQIPQVNVNTKRKKVHELSRRETDAIAERNRLDMELYRYARKLFDKQIREMIADVGREQYDHWRHCLTGNPDSAGA